MTASAAGRTTHIVVVGNEKGGSGKSTTAVHVAVSLLQRGHRVATIDLDSRQQTLTHHIENRRRWATANAVDLPLPEHRVIGRSRGDSVRTNTWEEYESFAKTLGALEMDHDFVVIDTPGSDTARSRMAHSAADTLITPINDSLVDLDVIASVDPVTQQVRALSHYAEMVEEARRERRAIDNGATDWVVVRNRLSPLETKNRRLMGQVLEELSRKLLFRVAPGISERVIFREFYAMGLTALDPLEASSTAAKPTMSHLAARQEVRSLIEALRLPFDEKGLRRLSARSIWNEASSRPLEMGDFVEYH